MRFREAHLPTLRDAPAEAEMVSHSLLLRAGYLRPLAAGIYSLLPLGLRVARRVEAIIREEMDAVGGLEVALPVVVPAEIWRESGRWDEVGPEMLRMKDRAGREMCLAMTHEEGIVALVRGELRSFRDLPRMFYQFGTKFRDEPRARGGLIRCREFVMKDAYSFHADGASLAEYYPRVVEAYRKIFRRAGLETIVVESDPGMMGGSVAHEFLALSPQGEDTLLLCRQAPGDCGYAANRQVASFRPDSPDGEAPRPREKVATPGAKTIEEVAAFLDVPARKTAKAVFFWAKRRGLVFAVVRGDLELNEAKLARAIGDADLRPAREDEIRACGAEPGFASPIGVQRGGSGLAADGRTGAFVVADLSVPQARNLVAGANEEGFHFRNVNMGDDWEADLVADIAAADAGHPCPRCGRPLEAVRGIEVGNTFQLGTRYTEAMGATVLDTEGKARPMVMGCYGIGVGRLLATVVEASHDDDGIIWPPSLSPFDIHLISAGKDAEVVRAADRLYEELSRRADVLYDDRDERPGVKFKDADLIGIPIRITVGRGVAKGVVEVRDRRTRETSEMPLLEVVRSEVARGVSVRRAERE